MRNHQGRIVYRSRNRKSWLPRVEQLEPRCVLNGGPMSHPNLVSMGKPLDDANPVNVAGLQSSAWEANKTAYEHISEFYNGTDIQNLGLRVVGSLNAGSLSAAEYTSAISSYFAGGPLKAAVVFQVSWLTSFGDTNYYEVSGFAIPSQADGSISTPARGNNSGFSRQPTGSIANNNPIPVQGSEVGTHIVQPVVAEVSAKLPAPVAVNQIVTTAGQSGGFAYTSGIVQHAVGAAVAYDVPVAGNLLAAGLNAADKFQQLTAKEKPALATIAHDVANWPVQKASLVNMPLNIDGMEKALEKVMGELGHLGTTFTDWLDARHLTAAAITVSVITIGGGTAIYLCRRGNKQGHKRDDEEASSSWLFARLHSAPDAS